MVDDRYARAVEFVRSVRHDANNPLTAALGHVQLLLADDPDHDAETLESLRVIESELLRLSGIIHRLAAVHSEGLLAAPTSPDPAES